MLPDKSANPPTSPFVLFRPLLLPPLLLQNQTSIRYLVFFQANKNDIAIFHFFSVRLLIQHFPHKYFF